jgi:hypothetical protein
MGHNVASYLNPIKGTDAPVLKLVEGDAPGRGNGLWELDYDLYNKTVNDGSSDAANGTININLLDAFGIQFWQLHLVFDRTQQCERGPQMVPSDVSDDVIKKAAQFTIGQDSLIWHIKPLC